MMMMPVDGGGGLLCCCRGVLEATNISHSIDQFSHAEWDLIWRICKVCCCCFRGSLCLARREAAGRQADREIDKSVLCKSSDEQNM